MKAVIEGHSIRRSITIEAPREKVWAAISDPEQIGTWFGDTASFDALEVGASGTFGWDDHGDFAVVITEYSPMDVFAWRWASDPGTPLTDDDSTVARFTLEAEGDATVLTVVESGFDALKGGTAHRRRRLDENRDGWNSELDELVALLS